MKQKAFTRMIATLLLVTTITGCGNASPDVSAANSLSTAENQTTTKEEILPSSSFPPFSEKQSSEPSSVPSEEITVEPDALVLTSNIVKLEEGFSAVAFEGEDGFEDFLAAGGASSDAQVVEFLSAHLLTDFDILGGLFGCSTIAVKNSKGEALFGRNFDWQACDALVVSSNPEHGYASISTVNMDFISQSGGLAGAVLRLDDVRTRAALYAPLDGMNEKGLAVSVNMISDGETINQQTDKPDLTTTTAIRLLLNKAASVGEALDLLGQYDMHASMGMMVHFALADTTGRSAVVEYINDEMIVTETPVVTNFYLSAGEKNGIGTAQSHQRYEILTQALAKQKTMDRNQVRDALDSVSKDNFGEFESTEWSIVFSLNQGVAHYYHRENYQNCYTFAIQ